MSLTITLNPNIASYALGEAPITVSQSGGTSGSDYLWESNNGTFSNKYASSPTFTPNNATKATVVTGNRIHSRTSWATSSSGGSTAVYGTNGGLTKLAGSTTSWDVASYTTVGMSSSTQGFFEFEVVETNTEKAGGFLANASYRDPNTIHASNAFTLCWHVYANGTAVPRKLGEAVTSMVGYKAGDVFRVQLEANSVTSFYHNGVKIGSTTTPSAGTIYGCVSFRSVGAKIDNPSFLNDTTSNQGSSSAISVTGVFPVEPNYALDLTKDNNTLSSAGEDGSSVFKVVSSPKRVIGLQFIKRPYEEYVLINDFWDFHQRHLRFAFKDTTLEKTYVVVHDSGIRTQVDGPDQFTISLTLREV